MITRFVFVFMCYLFCSIAYAEKPLYVSAPSSIWAEAKGFEMQGPIIDFVSDIFSKHGIPVVSQNLPWDRALYNLRNGKLDVMLVLLHTKEREEFIEYSIPYAKVPTSIFVPKGELFTFSSLDDLKGKTGLIVKGEQYGEKFDLFKSQLNLATVTTSEQMVEMLSKKRVDYAVSQYYAFLSTAERLDLLEKIDVLPQNVELSSIYIGFSKKSSFIKYLPYINDGIIEMKADGKINRIINTSYSTYKKAVSNNVQ